MPKRETTTYDNTCHFAIRLREESKTELTETTKSKHMKNMRSNAKRIRAAPQLLPCAECTRHRIQVQYTMQVMRIHLYTERATPEQSLSKKRKSGKPELVALQSHHNIQLWYQSTGEQ